MKTLVATLFTLSTLALSSVAMTATAETMTVLLPMLTYPETSPAPDAPGTPETGIVVTPTASASTKNCDPTAGAPVCVLQD